MPCNDSKRHWLKNLPLQKADFAGKYLLGYSSRKQIHFVCSHKVSDAFDDVKKCRTSMSEGFFMCTFINPPKSQSTIVSQKKTSLFPLVELLYRTKTPQYTFFYVACVWRKCVTRFIRHFIKYDLYHMWKHKVNRKRIGIRMNFGQDDTSLPPTIFVWFEILVKGEKTSALRCTQKMLSFSWRATEASRKSLNSGKCCQMTRLVCINQLHHFWKRWKKPKFGLLLN